MAAIDEVRVWLKGFQQDGSVRTDFPPLPEEKSYNPAIEFAPRKQLEELRDKHLRHIVRWAYDNSQFYRKMWDEAGVGPSDIETYDDLEKLPVWRKGQQRQDESENPPFGSRAVKELIPHVPNLYRSTGTTGKSTIYLWVPEDIEGLIESRARWWWSGGCRPGGVFFDFIPSARGSPAKVFDSVAKRLGLLHYHEEIFGYQADPEASCTFQLELGEFYKPLCTFVSPEFLITMGEQFRKLGKEPPHNVVLPGGAPLSTRLRQQLRSLYLKPKGFPNLIGAIESGIAVECLPSAEQGRDLFHEQEDLSVFEVVKPGTSRRAAPGERGELVITNFFVHASPFIRFGLEDVFENSSTTEPCPLCGRTVKTWLKSCPGRLRDMFEVKGKELMPWDVELVIGDIPDTTMLYQLIFDSWDMETLKIKLETLRKLPDPEYQTQIKATLESKLGIPVEVDVVAAGAIPTAAGGYKLMKIVDNRPKRTAIREG